MFQFVTNGIGTDHWTMLCHQGSQVQNGSEPDRYAGPHLAARLRPVGKCRTVGLAWRDVVAWMVAPSGGRVVTAAKRRHTGRDVGGRCVRAGGPDPGAGAGAGPDSAAARTRLPGR